MKTRTLTAAALAMGLALSASAADQIYNLKFDDTWGGGDTDGFGTGTLTINDVTGDISWNFTYGNIDSLTAMHIHGPIAPGGNAGVLVGLGVTTTGGENTLIGSNSTLTDLTPLTANPHLYYVNIHTSTYGGGAIRAIVPEPGSLALLGLGGLLLARRRRGA